MSTSIKIKCVRLNCDLMRVSSFEYKRIPRVYKKNFFKKLKKKEKLIKPLGAFFIKFIKINIKRERVNRLSINRGHT